MADIQISYQNVLNKAGELDELVGKLKSIRDNEFEAVRAQLASCWNGSASDEMQKKLNRLYDRLNSSITDLQNASGELRRQANDWYAREKAIQEAMRAAEEARKNAENAVNGIFDGIKNMFK